MTKKEIENCDSARANETRFNFAERKQFIQSLFKTHYAKMYRLAASMLLDVDESRDVVSEVFAQLLHKDTVLMPTTAEAYLMQSVRHACLNLLEQKRIREQANEEYSAASPTYSDEERLQMDELMRYVEDNLPQLTIRIFRLRYLQEMTCQEIADEVGVSRITVHTHLRQAKEKIKTFFDSNI